MKFEAKAFRVFKFSRRTQVCKDHVITKTIALRTSMRLFKFIDTEVPTVFDLDGDIPLTATIGTLNAH